MSNILDPFYDALNKTGDFGTKFSPAIKFDERYEVVLVDCILKNKYHILRKDRTYNIKVRSHGWSLVSQECMESINSAE